MQIFICRMKVKKSSTKASNVARTCPPFSEIWFVNKGTLLWTKAANESTSFVHQIISQSEPAACNLKSDSGIMSEPRGFWSMSARFCAGSVPWDLAEADPTAPTLSPTVSSSLQKHGSHHSHILSSPSSGNAVSEQEHGISSDSETRAEEEILSCQLEEVKLEVAASGNLACVELLKRKKLEGKALEAIKKVNLIQGICFHAFLCNSYSHNFLRLATYLLGLYTEEEVSVNIS